MAETAPNSNVGPNAKPALQSLTVQSAAAIAIAFIASKFKVALPDGAPQDIASVVIDLFTTLGIAGVAVGRARARGPLS